MKGFIISPSSRMINGKPCVLLYGRLENGQSFLTVNEFNPYFLIKNKDTKKVDLTEFKVEKTDLINFQKEKVSKIIFKNPRDVSEIKNELVKNNITTYEADINYSRRFLIDNKIQGSVDIWGDYETSETIDRIYTNPEFRKTDYVPKNLKIFSFDIETDKKAKKLYLY